ncbi:MAG: sulfite exporter TauE/SafE family protein [Armatimonadota bacterium]
MFKRFVIPILVGLFAGAYSGLLGVGGGLIIVPALVILQNYSQHSAHGTSLAALFITAAAGFVSYAVYGNINYTLVILLSVGGVIGAILGAKTADRISGKNLKMLFVFVMVFLGGWMVLKSFSTSYESISQTYLSFGSIIIYILLIITGIIAGFASSLLGIGGGVVVIPTMVILFGIDQKVAQGTSLACILPISLAGTIAHRKMGNVKLRSAFKMGIGSVIGSFIGASAAASFNSSTLQFIFGIFMIINSIALFMKKPQSNRKQEIDVEDISIV